MKKNIIAVIINIIVIVGIMFYFSSNSGSKFESIKTAVMTKAESTSTEEATSTKKSTSKKATQISDEQISSELGITATTSYETLLAETNLQNREIAATWNEYHAYNVVRSSDEIVTCENGEAYTMLYGITIEEVSSIYLNRNGAKLIVRVDENTTIDSKNTKNFAEGGAALSFFKNVYCNEHNAVKSYDNTCYPNAEEKYRPEYKKIDVIANIFNAFVIVKREVVVDNENIEVYMWAVKTCEHQNVSSKSSKSSKSSSRGCRVSDSLNSEQTPDHNYTPAPESDYPAHNYTPAPETKNTVASTSVHSNTAVAESNNSSVAHSHSNTSSSSTSSDVNENAQSANNEVNW